MVISVSIGNLTFRFTNNPFANIVIIQIFISTNRKFGPDRDLISQSQSGITWRDRSNWVLQIHKRTVANAPRSLQTL